MEFTMIAMTVAFKIAKESPLTKPEQVVKLNDDKIEINTDSFTVTLTGRPRSMTIEYMIEKWMEAANTPDGCYPMPVGGGVLQVANVETGVVGLLGSIA